MDINSLQGVTAYTNAPNATPPVENTQVRDQNLEAAGTDLNDANTRTAPKAFEVNITQEAQDRLAAQSNSEPLKTQTTTPEDQSNQNIVQTHEASRIVNIVA